MKCLTLILLLMSGVAEAANFTFSRHYQATRETLKAYCTTGYSEDAAIMLASSTWLGMDGNEVLCGTMVGIVIMEGGLTPPYDWKNYLSYAAMRPQTAFVAGSRLEKLAREEWLARLRENPSYATLLACQQFRTLLKAWKTANNTIRVWLAGPAFRTDKGEWNRSLKYLAGVEQFKARYNAFLKKTK